MEAAYSIFAKVLNGMKYLMAVTIAAAALLFTAPIANAAVNDALIANAGADAIVAEGVMVTLDGSASSDPEMQPLTYAWTQTAGMPMVTLSSANMASPTFTAPTQLAADAVLTFSLVVSDGNMDSTADTVTITVNAGMNDAPTANAGPDQIVDEGAMVTLDGRASADPEREAITYAWTQTSGMSVTLAGRGGNERMDTRRPRFKAPVELVVAAELVFSLVVTDARGKASPADLVTITVTAGKNDAPTANAGPDQIVDGGVGVNAVFLSGTASSDPEGESLSYAWLQISGTPVNLLRPSNSIPIFFVPQVGSALIFSLVVTDARGKASEPVTVTVKIRPVFTEKVTDKTYYTNRIVTNLNLPNALGVGNIYTLQGSPSLPRGLQFEASTRTLLGVPIEPGVFDLTYTVTDQGNRTDTLTFRITVIDATIPIADAGPDRIVDAGIWVLLEGNGEAVGAHAPVDSYIWTQTRGTPVVELFFIQRPILRFLTPHTAGGTRLEFSLIVTNTLGVRSTADTVTITVNAGNNDAPTANAGDDETVAEGAMVTLDGTGSTDPEGEDLTYAWTQTAGTTVTLSDNTDDMPTFMAPVQLATNAMLTFSLVVSDGTTASSADTVTITVNAGNNDAPTANAGDDETVAEGAMVALDGSLSSDPEMQPLTYAWTQTAGTTVTLSDNTDDMPTFMAPVQLATNAMLTFSLVVSDGTTASSADTVTITVNAGNNDAPTANAGDDETVAEGAMVTLDGTGSTDPEGEDLTYAWTQTAGTTVTLSDNTDDMPTFMAPDQLATNAMLTFSLVVSDGTTASSADTVTITVNAGNNDAPTANAGDDETVAEGAMVALDGSLSSDPEMQPLTYAWTQTAGTTVTLSDNTDDMPTFMAPVQLATNAMLTFSLVVSDGTTASSADTVTITVNAGNNDAPTANAGDDETVAEGAMVTLDGTGSTDPEGEDLTYAWTHSNAGITLSDAAIASPTFTAPENLVTNATLTFSLTVTDARMLVSVADTVTITVTAGNNDAPTANAGPDQTVAEGVTVALDGTGSTDSEGETLTYAWTHSNAGITLSDAAIASPTFTAPANLVTNATLTFSLTVTDARMLVSVADTVTITVTAGNNDAPTANAGPDQTVAEGVTVALDGTGSTDPEGEDLTYAWTQTAGTTVTLSDNTDDMPTFMAPVQLATNAMLTFSLVVSDGTTASSADTVTITVNAGNNDAPTANAGDDETVAEGAMVALDGSLSSDPEMQPLTYAWTQTAGTTVTLSDNTDDMPTFMAPVQLATNAMLTFSLVVSDGTTASSADTVTITVNAGNNDAPTANAGDDETVAEGAMVALDGSLSSDPEMQPLTYAWTQTAGTTVTLSDNTDDIPTFMAPVQLATNAMLTFSLVVSDGTTASSADTVTITVNAGNNDAPTANAPTANAGDDETVAEGAMVALDGSLSSDPEMQPLTYAWTQTAGTTVTLSDNTDDMPTFMAPVQLATNAMLTFSLVVSDGTTASSADTVTITVNAGNNDAPTANAGDDETVAEGAMVALDGSLSSDPEMQPLTYAWTQTAGTTVTLSDNTDDMPTFMAPVQLATNAMLTFSLVVSDGTTASSADTVTITVNAGNNDAPTANAPTADAGNAQTVAEGAMVTLDGTGSTDPEGEDLTYAWTHSNAGITLSDAAIASPTFTAPENLVTNATLTFSLTVTDARMLVSVADTVTITVTAGMNDAPTADAGNAQTVAEGITVALDGSASSDPENEMLTYAWTQTAGTTVNLSNANTVSPTFTAPANLVNTATLTFSLTVTDTRGATDTDTVTITVTGTNDAPTADAGTAQTVAEGARVTLDGSASSDPENEMLTYAWTQTAGTTATLSDADTVSPTFMAPVQLLADAELTFSLVVSDGTTASTADTVTITVTGTNDAPTADAGNAQTVAEGITVVLDGSASSDPENEMLTYAWTQTAGTTVTLSDANTVSPTFMAPDQLATNALLTFSLVVNDGTTASSADTVTITVTAGMNDAPTAYAGNAQTVAEGITVALDGSASSDPENEMLTYAWTQTAGTTVNLSNANTVSPTFTAPANLVNTATLTFSLTVTDARGATDTDTVTITVTGTNDAPTADAGTAQTVAEGARVTLDGSASSDPENEMLTYVWTHNNMGITLSDADTVSPTFMAPVQLATNAMLTFSLVVSDGTTASSADTVTITVNAGNNDAPTANAGDAQTVAEGITVVLDGSASSDPEGEDLTYAWTQTAGTTVTLSDNTDDMPTFMAPDQLATNAMLTFSLVVNDGTTASSADTVTITVTAGMNDAPTAYAGNAQTVAEGITVALDGSASSDPENEMLTYAWTQTAGTTVNLSNANTVSPTFTAPANLVNTATLTFSLTVTDTRGATDTDTVTITVTGTNDAPTADAGTAQTVAEGARVTLDGSASSDPENEMLTYVWTHSNMGITLSDADTVSPTFMAPVQLLADAELTFSLVVSDGTTASSADTVTITVTGTNDVPTADAGNAQTVAEGITVVLDGSASSDPENEMLTYAWTQTAGTTVTLSDANTVSPTFMAPDQLATNAMLTFSLVVNDGTTASSADTVIITVTAGANDAPIANAGADMTVTESARVTLDGSASSDPENEMLTYAWTQTFGMDMGIDGVNTAALSFRTPNRLDADVVLVFTLEVTDPRSATDTDTVQITVKIQTEARVQTMETGLAVFGRAVAESVADTINQRFKAASSTSMQATLGGVSLAACSSNRATPDRRETGGSRPDPFTTNPLFCRLPSREQLSHSSFFIPLGRLGDEPNPPDTAGTWTLWGRGNFNYLTHRSHKDFSLSLDGSVISGYVGLDYRLSDNYGQSGMLGLILGHNEGELDYHSAANTGGLQANLSTLYPYGYWSPRQSLSLWGLAGIGTGDATLKHNGTIFETALDMRMGLLGLRQTLSSKSALEWAVKADFFIIDIETGVIPGLPTVAARASQARLVLEARTNCPAAPNARLSASFGLGARVDGGDASHGAGAELSTRLEYINTRLGLSVALRGQGLLTREQFGFKEWGASLNMQLDMDVLGRGLALALSPVWGQAPSGSVQALWESGRALQPNLGTTNRLSKRMAVDLSYGLNPMAYQAQIIPFATLELADGIARHLRLGMRLKRLDGLQLELFIGRDAREHSVPEHFLGLTSRLHF